MKTLKVTMKPKRTATLTLKPGKTAKITMKPKRTLTFKTNYASKYSQD
jgi:hypothetical protein